MSLKENLIVLLIIPGMLISTQISAQDHSHNKSEANFIKTEPMKKKINKTETEWETCLTPEQYRVLREKGTEIPFSGKYYHFDKKGIYICAACGNKLFTSKTKYDSGSGWPSFFRPYSEDAIEVRKDRSAGMVRLEILCGQCGSHLGHVFPDGPQPTGLRYCVNSLSLDLKGK